MVEGNRSLILLLQESCWSSATEVSFSCSKNLAGHRQRTSYMLASPILANTPGQAPHILVILHKYGNSSCSREPTTTQEVESNLKEAP